MPKILNDYKTIYTHTDMYLYIYMHIHTNTHTHTHTHTYPHTQTHIPTHVRANKLYVCFCGHATRVPSTATTTVDETSSKFSSK